MVFQFQSGTVKRAKRAKGLRGVYEFQFQSGTVKRMVLSQSVIPVSCFNSNLVRLKVAIVHVEIPRVKVFQFQSGTVKRLPAAKYGVTKVRVSIPIWYG